MTPRAAAKIREKRNPAEMRLADALALAVKIAHENGIPLALVLRMTKALASRHITRNSTWARVTGRPEPRIPRRRR